MAGCGGGGASGVGGAGGVVVFTVRWPDIPTAGAAVPALIPQAARSIRVALTVANQSVVPEKLVVREAAGPTTAQVQFDNVPITTVTALATAYPNPNGTGVPLAKGTVPIVVQSAQTTRATLVLDSTVAGIEISPSPITVAVDAQQQLTATARDADGNVVLLTPGALQWQVQPAALAAVDADGVLTGSSVGDGQVIVTDTESGKTNSATLHVEASGAGTVRGVVTAADTPQVAFLTVAGLPVVGATVTTSDGASIFATQTGADGSYLLSDIPAGSRVISISAPGYLTQHHFEVMGTTGLVLNAELGLNPDPSPTDPPTVTLDEPTVNNATGLAVVTGTVTNLDSGSAAFVQNGQESLLPVADGAFRQVVVLQSGANDIVVRATNAAGTTLTRTITINYDTGVTGDFYFRVTFTWDQGSPTNRTDMDLHVWSPSDEHCAYWDKTIACGSLDVDNTQGFGPENFTCTGLESGLFRVAVNFFSAYTEVPTGCVIRVTTGTRAANAVNELRGPHQLTVGNGEDDYPVTVDTPSWWRPCDVQLDADGRVTVLPPDTSVPLAGPLVASLESVRAHKK
ncbi:MAG: Ig-like domain-containing protein [Armatimonadetes bacterium]|nr:Ig-like domain-containing protein [Armatimonadota bacterium]